MVCNGHNGCLLVLAKALNSVSVLRPLKGRAIVAIDLSIAVGF